MGDNSSFDISASGIFAQRTRLDAIANNIANAETTKTAEGGPYARQRVVFRAVFDDATGNRVNPMGVKVESVVQDTTDYRTVFDPGHPDADANGYLRMPNINVVEEMTDMISATRVYEANITALNAAKS